jgi:Asp/Glu/hydantoin racemase
MTKTLALIHTSPVLTPLFTDLCKQHLANVQVFHMVDESLIRDTITNQRLRKLTIRRLISMIESAQGAGADAVLVTCSSIGPAVDLAREIFDLPVVRVDEAMAEQAVRHGPRIGVLATLRTTLEPTMELLRCKAADAGVQVQLVEGLCDQAFEAVLAGDTATHDRIVTEALLDMAAKVDVIVLAQASMSRVAANLPAGSTAVQILASPELGVLRMKKILEA